MIARLSWPPIVAVCCFLAALALAVWLPDRLALVLALSGGAVTFSILSIRDAATRDMGP